MLAISLIFFFTKLSLNRDLFSIFSSIEEFFSSSQDTNLVWENIDENTNLTFEFNFNNTTHSARIYGIDYANNLQFKHKYSHLLYEDKEHWLKGQEKESVY